MEEHKKQGHKNYIDIIQQIIYCATFLTALFILSSFISHAVDVRSVEDSKKKDMDELVKRVDKLTAEVLSSTPKGELRIPERLLDKINTLLKKADKNDVINVFMMRSELDELKGAFIKLQNKRPNK